MDIANFSNVTVIINCSMTFGCFLRYSVPLSVIFSIFYGIVFVVGFVGNISTLVILSRDQLNSPYYIFIRNLAISDVMVILFCLPLTLLSNLFGPWIFGILVCKVVSYLQGVSVCASVSTLVAIAVERFRAICHPMQWQITTFGSRYVIALIWLFSLTLLLPWFRYFNLIAFGKTTEGTTLEVCQDVWPSVQVQITYFVVVNLLLIYIFPLLVFSVCYGLIWHTLRNRVVPCEDDYNRELAHQSMVKVVKMQFTVVLVFLLSWLPLYALFLRLKIGREIVEDSLEDYIIQVTVPLTQWLGTSNSCMNPLLYAYFNKKMRLGFKSLLCCGNRNAHNDGVVRFQNNTAGRPVAISTSRV